MTTPDADEVPLWNIANILTVVRCVMVPLLVVLAALYAESAPGRVAVTVVFLLAMLTVLLDGHLARSRNLITGFGKIMDRSEVHTSALQSRGHLVCRLLLEQE